MLSWLRYTNLHSIIMCFLVKCIRIPGMYGGFLTYQILKIKLIFGLLLNQVVLHILE